MQIFAINITMPPRSAATIAAAERTDTWLMCSSKQAHKSTDVHTIKLTTRHWEKCESKREKESDLWRKSNKNCSFLGRNWVTYVILLKNLFRMLLDLKSKWAWVTCWTSYDLFQYFKNVFWLEINYFVSQSVLANQVDQFSYLIVYKGHSEDAPKEWSQECSQKYS